MKKQFEIQAINHALYEARNKKKLTLKDAAKALKIHKLHLKLIERGYLHVSKRLQPRFIAYYHLSKDFFTANTTYVEPVNVTYEDPHIDEKIRTKIKKKKTKITSGIISALLLGVLGTGLYYFNCDRVNPRANWTESLATFHDEVLTKSSRKEPSTEYPDDLIYYVEDNSNYVFTMPGQDTHITGIDIVFTDGVDTAEVYTYNQKKIVYFECYNVEATITALATYKDSRETYDLPKITIATDVSVDYYPESQEYKDFYNTYLKQGEWFDQKIEAFNNSLTEQGYSPYTYDQIMNDTQKVSANEVFNFTLGFRLVLIPSILLALSLSVFVYALVKGRKIKPKKVKAKPYVVHKTEYTADAALVYRSVPNDTKFPMIVPEFVLRVVALGFLLFASIGTSWLTEVTLIMQDSIISEIGGGYISNFLVTGITLAFFLKLDVYHKKTNRELLDNIITLFVFGLMFYVAECVTYACLTNRGTLYSSLAGFLTTLLPGNIIWNIMLYSLIFFFLFTLPKKLEDAPHKVLIWRLGSVIPTLLLIAAFFYQGTFKATMSPYVSFLFHTNGILCTAFAIFYLYSLFFFQQYVSLKYGKDFTKVFVDSRRYALEKNIIACIVIFLLAMVDLLFYFYLPINSLNLGNNWIIAVLIPFILLYRPHIGKRSPKWDLIYTVLYVVFLTAGLFISLGMITNTLDLTQLKQIFG